MSNVSVRKYGEPDQDIWDKLIYASVNGSIMHSQKFLNYHPDDRFDRDDRILYLKDKPVAVFPLARSRQAGKTRGASPYGASFGGIVSLSLSSLNAEMLAQALAKSLVADGYDTLSIVLAPACYDVAGGSSINYFLLKAACQWTSDKGLCTVVNLRNRRPSQSYVRNSRKSRDSRLTVVENGDVGTFYPILRETVEQKHNGSITHTKQELDALKTLLGERMRIFLACLDGKAIAGVLVFEENDCVQSFYNCHLASHASLNPLHFLYEHIISRYQGEKEWLDLGLSDRVYVPTNRGLLQFKEGMGGVPMYREYYELALSK